MNYLQLLEEMVDLVQQAKPKYYNKIMITLTKKEIETLFKKGLTVKEAAAELSTKYNQKMSEGKLRSICKTAGIDLRKKPKPSIWAFMDEVEEVKSPEVNNS